MSPASPRKPIGMQEYFYSPMRAVVADVDDPEQRLRVRVRVVGMHSQKIPVDALPWAEVACLFVAKQTGDFMPFNVGDLVWVMFEGGDRRLPLVTGSWVSRSGNLTDVPNAVSSDYLNTRKRWVRIDRAGDRFELSENPNELWAKMVSGATEVVCDQKTDTVTLRAESGTVSLKGASVEVSTQFYALGAGQILIAADDLDGAGGGAGLLQLMARVEANLYAHAEVTVGGYLPRYMGEHDATDSGMRFRQSVLAALRPRKLVVGTATGETVDDCPLPETETVEVNGVVITIQAATATNSPSGETVKISIKSDADIEITAIGKTTVSSDDDVTVKSTGGDVTVESTAGKVTINGSDEVDVNADTINIASGTAVNLT